MSRSRITSIEYIDRNAEENYIHRHYFLTFEWQRMGQFRLIRIFRVHTFAAITHLFTFIVRHLIEPYRIFFCKIYYRTHRGKQIFRSIVHPVRINLFTLLWQTWRFIWRVVINKFELSPSFIEIIVVNKLKKISVSFVETSNVDYVHYVYSS